MLIPSPAIALIWTLRAQRLPDKEILAALRKPLTPKPEPTYTVWFHAWRAKRATP